MDILKTELGAVPAVRYALGVAGVLAAAALVKAFFSSAQEAGLVAVGMLLLMVLLLLFAAGTKLAPHFLQRPALVFTWSILILFVMCSSITVLSVFSACHSPFLTWSHNSGARTLHQGPTLRIFPLLGSRSNNRSRVTRNPLSFFFGQWGTGMYPTSLAKKSL